MTGARVALAAVLLLGAWDARACTAREPTRETGPGPHDYSLGTTDARLWREGDAGEPLYFRGRVLDTCGDPLAGARVRILHANHEGGHEPDRWRADLRADALGTFKIVTVSPGYTGGIARHIHFAISHPDYRELVTRLFFKNDPSIGAEVEDLAMVPEEIQRDGRRGWAASFEFVLRAR